MVVAAQGRAIPQAHSNIGDPAGPGCGRRSEACLPDSQGPGPAAANGGEGPGLYGQDRPRSRIGFSAEAPPALIDGATAFLQAVRANLLEIVNFVNFTGFVPEEIRSRRWASVTFQGARIALAFRLEGAGAEEAAGRFLSGLDARNFELRGHLLADVSLVAEERRPGFARIRLEALTVEEK